jgi:hypothetical protein
MLSWRVLTWLWHVVIFNYKFWWFVQSSCPLALPLPLWLCSINFALFPRRKRWRQFIRVGYPKNTGNFSRWHFASWSFLYLVVHQSRCQNSPSNIACNSVGNLHSVLQLSQITSHVVRLVNLEFYVVAVLRTNISRGQVKLCFSSYPWLVSNFYRFVILLCISHRMVTPWNRRQMCNWISFTSVLKLFNKKL